MLRKAISMLIIVCCLIAAISCSSEVNGETAFRVGKVYYKSLQEACEAIAGDETNNIRTVEILRDSSGPGVNIDLKSRIEWNPNYILIDLGENTYTVNAKTTATDADFKISGGLLSVSGKGGEIKGSSNTFFTLSKSQMVVGQGITLKAADSSILFDAENTTIFVDSYFDGVISGDMKINNGKLVINSKDGSISVGSLKLSGNKTQVIFSAQRDVDNTTIDAVTCSDNSPFTFTTEVAFEEDVYDDIDEILKNTAYKVHRHVMEILDTEAVKATCCTNRLDSRKCNCSGCNFKDYYEVPDTKNPDNHCLKHIDAVEPTASSNGIVECRQCEYCYRYFSLDGENEQINPIILATNNLNHSVVSSNIEELDEAMRELDEVKSLHTKGISLDLVSSVAGLVGVDVLSFFDDTDGKLQNITEKLVKIESQLTVIQNNMNILSQQLKAHDLGQTINARIKDLTDFNAATDASFNTLFEKVGEKYVLIKDVGTIKSVITYWGGESSNGNIAHAISIMNGVYPYVSPSSNLDNIFNIYDTLGRDTAGWEKESWPYRKAVRALESYTIARAYLMGRLYAEYSTNLPDALRDACSESVNTAYTDKFCKYYKSYEIDESYYSDKICCYISGCRTFYKQVQIANYSDLLNKNKDKYKFKVNSESVTTSSIDSLISDAGCSYLPLDFYNTIAKWYNDGKDEEEKKSIYEILTEYGFTDTNGGDLSDNYSENIFLVADNTAEFDGGVFFEDVVTSYRMVSFYQKKFLKNMDWIGINSVLNNAKDPSMENKKIRENCNIKKSSGEITNIGDSSDNKFFSLQIIED